MPKDSSAIYYQDNKEKLQKKGRERYQSISEKEKSNMVMKNTKIYQNMKNKSWLSIEIFITK